MEEYGGVVFLLKAEFRLIGGNKREADFCFYSRSIFLITWATPQWIWLLSKEWAPNHWMCLRLGNHGLRTSEMRRLYCEEGKDGEWRSSEAPSKQKILWFVLKHITSFHTSSFAIDWRLKKQRKEFSLMENHLWSLDWMKWQILKFFMAFLLYSLK